MKIRITIVAVLLINMLILVVLQLNVLKEITNSKVVEKKCVDAMKKINLKDHEMQVSEIQDVELENVKPDNLKLENTEKNTSKIEKEASVKMISDNPNIGIVITNDDNNLYHSKITFESSGIITIYYGENFQNIRTFSKKAVIKGKEYFAKNKKIKITSDKKMKIQGLSKVAFDGSFYVYKESDGFVAVNELDVETYLYGVVSSEMPSSFELEALKAQAVCARTYTYSHLENNKYAKYNAIMDDTVSYQAYANTEASKKIKKAVDKTRGQVLTVGGKLINAYYFSTSCGYTTDSKIWGSKEYEYLKSKYVSQNENAVNVSTNDYFKQFIKNKAEDYEKECTFYRWNVTIKKDSVERGLSELKGETIGDIDAISVLERGAGGIISKIEIKGKKKNITLTNQNEIRQVFSPNGYKLHLNDNSERTNMTSLPSAFFVVEKINDTEYRLTGGGFGHGSGMSQYGAHEMAKDGKKYNDILTFFYTGVTCDQINTQQFQPQ